MMSSSQADTVRVLVANDNSLISDSICALLKTWESINVVGTATINDNIVEVVKKRAPDVIIIDADMLPLEIDHFISKLRAENGGIKILFISDHEDRECILRGLRSGSNGYLPKRATSSDLIIAINAVYNGGFYLYPSIAKTIVGEYLRIKKGLSPDPYDQLSNTDKVLFKLLAEGHKSRQVAEFLNTTRQTVTRKKASVMSKLRLHNQTELVKYAIRKHLIEP